MWILLLVTAVQLDSVAAVRPDTTVADGPIVWVVSDHRLDRRRLAELVTGSSPAPMLLRSTSTLLAVTSPGARNRGGLIAPEAHMVNNSALPFSVNDGALWAGRGTNWRVGAGAWLVLGGRISLVLAPELTVSENRFFTLREPGYYAPPLPPDRSEFTFPWYQGPYSIDMPTRFGPDRLTRLHPGQSSFAVRAGRVAVGFATENQWWGPGLQNALILSNNAPGFPHLFLRAASPLTTALGDFDFRWIVGGLEESAYFDTDTTNDLRALSAAAVTLRPRGAPNLTIGAARSVWGTAGGWSDIPGNWYRAFAATGRPSNRPFGDSTLTPGGYEQLFSLFARWIFPSAGLETYAEWGRTEFPTSFRDLLVAPEHTQAYTLGLQWRRPGFRPADFWRVQLENTSVEQSATFRDRPVGVWYTSRRVIQGYTNRGQPLGAAVGPGSSGQSFILDYILPSSWIGVKLGRMRLNEDVRSIYTFPDYQNWCNHDINLYAGVHGGWQSPAGFISADATFANRVQPWFQVLSGCPRGDSMIDIRNTTLSVTIAPFSRRAR